MTDLSIPTALDPHGNHVPIEEATHKLDYYRCPRCEEFVDPRQGPKRQYFAHKRGVLEDKSCPLSSQADVDEMIDELRKSDIEKGEDQRSIRLYLGERHGNQLGYFGVIPSLEWGQIPQGVDVDGLLSQLEIVTDGVTNPPVTENFHPRESETVVPLDPGAGEYEVEITGPEELDAITGLWTAEGLSPGDLFVGDQRRARRHQSNRLIKEGEWVYFLTALAPPHLPDLVSTYEIGSFDVLAFPAREETEELLEEHGEGLTTDAYGFDADVILPADAHPTIEAPVYGTPEEPSLIGITPSDEIDPMFEVVAIPKRAGDVVDLEPTGPGNPRYYPTIIPRDGSRRVSVHQRNSDRHRLIHLHPVESDERIPSREAMKIGIEISVDDQSVFLSPLNDKQAYEFDQEFNPHTLPAIFEYHGPEGLELEVTGSFIDNAQFASRITRFTSAINELAGELSNWIINGCESVRIDFGGHGAVELVFPQPTLATALERRDDRSGSAQES